MAPLLVYVTLENTMFSQIAGFWLGAALVIAGLVVYLLGIGARWWR
jgi:hypothetical protein